MEHALSICLGLGLAAAAGFRIFVPLLAMSVAAYTGHLELGEGFRWIGTLPALVAFSTATLLEIGAYYLGSTTCWTRSPAHRRSWPPRRSRTWIQLLKWSLAIIGGGGLAGIVKGTTTLTRGASTATTGGLTNWMLSSFEAGASLLLSMFAILLPLVTMAIVVFLAYVAAKRIFGWLGASQEA